MHIHSKCNHELKYCEQCDIVYCEKCNKEWKKEIYSYSTWPYNLQGPNNTVPCNYSHS